MKKNYYSFSIAILVTTLVLLSGNVFSQLANWHLNAGDSSIYYNSGNVGIGVHNPAYKLDVNGDVRINGSLNFQGWATVSYNGGFGTTGPNGWNMIFDENGWLSVGEFAMTFNQWAPLTVTAYTTNTNNYVQPFSRFAGFGLEDGISRYFDVVIANPENASYNNIVKENDFSLSWKDDNDNSQSPGLVIAPYYNSSTETTGGIRVDVSGKVGIGVKDPQTSLDVFGKIKSNEGILCDTYFGNTNLYFKTLNQTRFLIDTLGNVGIGSVNPNSKFQIAINDTIKALSIYRTDLSRDAFRVMGNGKVYATEVNVLVTTDFPDYVFEKNYNLMSLGKLEQYIKTYKHLPQVPTQMDVAEKGVNVGDMQTILLKKVEELTLYIIELKKENEVLKNRVDVIEKSTK